MVGGREATEEGRKEKRIKQKNKINIIINGVKEGREKKVGRKEKTIEGKD